MRTRNALFAALLPFALSVVACGGSGGGTSGTGDDGTGSGDPTAGGGVDDGTGTGAGTGGGASAPVGQALAFHGEENAVPGFSYDTGYQPSGSNVQIRFVASTAGQHSVDAHAHAGGSADAPEVVGDQAGGKFAMDLHLILKVYLKIGIKGVTYEGPLPVNGAPNMDIAFQGNQAFDPFLLGGPSVTVESNQPPKQAASIPLSTLSLTGLGGSVVINVGGDMKSTFAGTCAAASAGKAYYDGTTTTNGTLTIEPTIVVSGPFGFSKKVAGVSIPVPVKDITAPLSLGSVDIAAGPSLGVTGAVASKATVGTCTAPADPPPAAPATK